MLHLFFPTLAVGKDKGFELYQKIFELGSPTLQVQQCFCN